MTKPSNSNLGKIILFTVSVAASSIIGIYVARFFERKPAINMKVYATYHSRDELELSDINIILSNDGRVSLNDLMVSADFYFGIAYEDRKPKYGETSMDNIRIDESEYADKMGNPVVGERLYFGPLGYKRDVTNYRQCLIIDHKPGSYVTWDCKSFNPEERIALTIERNVVIPKEIDVLVTAQGYSKSNKFRVNTTSGDYERVKSIY